MNGAPRVALVSIGIGRIQRGFERYFSDLFGVLRDRLPITLYKGGGEDAPSEKVPSSLAAWTRITRHLPLKQVAAEYPEYRHDCLAYAVSMLPDLLQDRFDVVHVIDPPLVYHLQRLRMLTRFRPRLLFTNGCHMPPQYYPRAHVQHVAEVLFQEALASGVSPDRITLAPCGFHPERFEAPETREELRRSHGIPPDTFVILDVSAMKRSHKRVDHLIQEVARLDGDVLLWLDGKPEDPEIPDLAERLLGPRCRITFVPSAKVRELYALADVFAHAALEESFGLGLVEAASTGLPTIAHDSPHFAWLLGGRENLVDMSRPGALAAKLAAVRTTPAESRAAAAAVARDIRARFDWRNLAACYEALYARVAGSA